jgi:DNA-binding transcriptional LysR family regulator
MDTELARTFLTVVATGSFVGAAEQLHVTQSTVSARLQALEGQLGCKLFVRNKSGAVLTPAGKLFQKHAITLVRTVEQARHDVGISRGYRAALTIGGRFGLWEQFLLKWSALMRQAVQDVTLRTEIGFEADLMQGLIEGRLDIGVMYTPQNRPGLKVERLFEEQLVLVSTEPKTSQLLGPKYVYVDWGPEFYSKHNASFPDFLGPAVTANIGWLGLQHILENGGSGYFPIRLVRSHLKDGVLKRWPDVPTFSLSAYAVYADQPDSDLIERGLRLMRRLAKAEEAQHT